MILYTNKLNLTHTRIFVPHLRKGTGDAFFWATSNQKEVFTGKAVGLLFEIAARPILFSFLNIYKKLTSGSLQTLIQA